MLKKETMVYKTRIWGAPQYDSDLSQMQFYTNLIMT